MKRTDRANMWSPLFWNFLCTLAQRGCGRFSCELFYAARLVDEDVFEARPRLFPHQVRRRPCLRPALSPIRSPLEWLTSSLGEARMEINRREFLAGSASIVAVAAAGGCVSTTSGRPLPKYAYVGCYTTKQRNGRGEGITVHRIDPSGAWSQVQLVKTADNPSWLTFD